MMEELQAFAKAGNSSYLENIKYYTRENCIDMGYLPNWTSPNYSPRTYFERLFKSPLAIDLMAAGNYNQAGGFEQVTADWGCDFKSTYGKGTKNIGFFGPGAKDPAGGGCPKGPVKVYEDLVCAIQLGLRSNPQAFKEFCSTELSEEEGMFECLAFFANVLIETGSFSQTEERDPRPYCWNREANNKECCPAKDHVPCMPDSDKPLDPSKFPANPLQYLTDAPVEKKCCSYHGRGFLQISYEPNYKALSRAMYDDETVLWHHPYKLRSDGIMGWTAALWFWFFEHKAQINSDKTKPLETLSPRSQLLKWQIGKGFPATIAMINGAECNGSMDSKKAAERTSALFTLARKMNAKPPVTKSETPINYYPLPGTKECEDLLWCRKQFHNTSSVCPIFNTGFTCALEEPIILNVSTPMGWNRKIIKLSKFNSPDTICRFQYTTKDTSKIWQQPTKDIQILDEWWKMLDIHVENVCDMAELYYFDPKTAIYLPGDNNKCQKVWWKDFADKTCKQIEQVSGTAQKPCKTLAEYVSRPIPNNNFESGNMNNYVNGVIKGRCGPGLVKAMNTEAFNDREDSLCYWFGGTACGWTVTIGTHPDPKYDPHNCRIYPADVNRKQIYDTLIHKKHKYELDHPHDRPEIMKKVLKYYDESNCKEFNNQTVLEQILVNKDLDLDYLLSGYYSGTDGFANERWDSYDQLRTNNNNVKYGLKGPKNMWKSMLCAYYLGVPNDPSLFRRELFRRSGSQSVELSEDDIDFAKLELISFFANVIKETGALGQAEEQDPRAYCNWQGGSANKCCENYWGNNPPCVDRGEITPSIRESGLTTQANCCSYHGRGFLQTSYEINYGNLGAIMFSSDEYGVSKETGRRLMIDYPQTIDAFGITGWTAAFIFWLKKSPCLYCNERKADIIDWNAKQYSPHEAMLKYDSPGEGFGKTINIINGMECEAKMSWESPISQFGAQMRLAFLYNLAYRFQVKAPGEKTILPLPGTRECDESKWCRGTFGPVNKGNSNRITGSCWAITPQPYSENEQLWTYCIPGKELVNITTKYSINMKIPSFSIETSGQCVQQNMFKCGIKAIDKNNKPSMFTNPELKAYVVPPKKPVEWNNLLFHKAKDMTTKDLCSHAYDIYDTKFPNDRDCEWWCNQSSGGGTCKEMNPVTCEVAPTGLAFVNCVNEFFKTLTETKNCVIDLNHKRKEKKVIITKKGCTQPNCSKCISTSNKPYDDEHCKPCIYGRLGDTWPCALEMCKCIEFKDPPKTKPCDATCKICISSSGKSWEDDQCVKCANGMNRREWPCNLPKYCMCGDQS